MRTALDQVVCEVPQGRRFPPGFCWYELAIAEHDSADALADVARSSPAGATVVAATMAADPSESLREVGRALDAGLSHVLFEAADTAHLGQLVRLVRSHGASPMAETHLGGAGLTAPDLLSEVTRLADSAPDHVKVAYPAPTATDVACGLAALDQARSLFGMPITITPMGCRWGRIAAALAGSALVFAPIEAAADRHSAAETVALIDALRAADGAAP